MLTLPRLMNLFPTEWSGQRAAMATPDALPGEQDEACRREARSVRRHGAHPYW